MKQALGLFILMNFFGFVTLAVDIDYHGYLRGGTGSNSKGGKQECFYNSGLPGNFMRLGNECSFYSELAFEFNHLKATPLDPHYFRTEVRIEAQSNGTRQWESSTNRDINQIEAYVQGGGFSELPGDYWVGKRFYRDVDVHIFDWYYYADMSGVGAGVENVPLNAGAAKGTWSLAHLIQTEESTKTSVGKPTLQAVDLRIKDLIINDSNKLHFWTVYAWAPRGTDSSTGAEYVKTSGYVLASKWTSQLAGGNNTMAAMYGQGAMKDFNIYGSSTVSASDDKQNRASSYRIINDWNRDVTDKWALMLAAAANRSENGSGVRTDWYAFGVRPTYAVSDHVQWVFEAGFNSYKNSSETETSTGNALGERTLGRLTVAPQLSLSKSIWGRPVMRAFVSHSFWNSANKTNIASSAPSYADSTEGTSFGYQFEVWY